MGSRTGEAGLKQVREAGARGEHAGAREVLAPVGKFKGYGKSRRLRIVTALFSEGVGVNMFREDEPMGSRTGEEKSIQALGRCAPPPPPFQLFFFFFMSVKSRVE